MRIILTLFISLLVGVGSHVILDLGFNIDNPIRFFIVMIPIFITFYIISWR